MFSGCNFDTHIRIIKMVTLSWWGRIQDSENQQAGLHGRSQVEGGSSLDISDDEVDHDDDDDLDHGDDGDDDDHHSEDLSKKSS